MIDVISAADALAASRAGDVVVVDARPQVVRHSGSLPGAVVVEPDETDTEVLAKRLPAARDVALAVVSVRSRAREIAERLNAFGYDRVSYVQGDFRPDAALAA